MIATNFDTSLVIWYVAVMKIQQVLLMVVVEQVCDKT